MRVLRAVVSFAPGLVCLLWVAFFYSEQVSADNRSVDTDAKLLTASGKAAIQEQAIHILGGNVNVTSRWITPVRFAVVTDPGEIKTTSSINDTAQKIMRDVASITSLPLSFVSFEYQSLSLYLDSLRRSKPYQLLPCDEVNECANLVVVVTSPAIMKEIVRAVPLGDVYQEMLGRSDHAICFFAPFQKASVIRQAMVFVRSDLSPAMVRTCLQEEIYQSFGLFSDYTDSDYFSFNNRVESKSITRYDRALLKTVYQFPAGTAAFVIVREFMAGIE